jgi:3-oxoacyl-[acyl-carrier-protein] synthase II
MNRVVVTGLGAVTAVGHTVPEMWSAIASGQSGAGPITHFDASSYTTRIAAQVTGLNPAPYLSRKEARRLDPFIHFAVTAAGQAIQDAGVEGDGELDGGRVGVLIGSGIGGLGTILDQYRILLDKGPQGVSPFLVPGVIANMPGGLIAQKYGFTGPNFALVSACATGNHALGEAMHAIRRGSAEVMICGAAESSIVELCMAGFCALRAMSTSNDDPEHACRPFDVERNGFVMGEGAAVFVLESLEHARRRGARVYAELAGYGATADAHHFVAPDPEGKGAATAMRLALQDAGIPPNEVDYINAHGTGTPLNDPIETKAIKAVFGDVAYAIPVSSTKAATGHLLGAASALEAVITLMAMQHNLLPPTLNLTAPDPACDLDYVPLVARPAKIRVAMSNGFGFGGHNASVVFRKLA